MADVELRQYLASDHDAVLQLHFKGLEQTGVRLNAKLALGLDDDLSRIEEAYLIGGDFLITTIDNKIVGMGAFQKIDDETAEIKRMRVEPDYQGKGIGSLILDTLIDKAKAAGYRKLVLDTTDKMQAAQHLYRSRGFKEYKRSLFGDIMIIFYELNFNNVIASH